MKLTTEQKTILIDTCNAMINREATSDYSANLREVAKIALSVLTTETVQPVAWRHDDGPFAGMALTRSQSVADSWIANGWTVTPLFPAPPAPAAPEVLKNLLSIVRNPRALPRSNEWVSGQQYSYVLLENVEAMFEDALRAEMLAQERSNGGHDGKISD